MISSPHNPRLKALKRLATRRGREQSGRFAVEGEDLIAAARAAGRPALDGYRLAGTSLGEAGFHDVEQSVLRSVSTLGSGARVIAVYEQRWGAPVGPLCVYLHGVGDPGNVGTIVRSAHAFGASCVALGPRCADPHSPKAARASMGAIFAVSLAHVRDVDELPGVRVALSARAVDVLRGEELTGAAGEADASHVAASDPQRARAAAGVTLLVGAEREGLPERVLARCERRARIPIGAESLNAAMAATVALYELTRASGEDPGSHRVRG